MARKSTLPPDIPVPSASPDNSLSPNEILIAEFEYAATCATQANEDRSKAASFFLVSVGSLVATIFGAQQGGISSQIYFILAGLFFILTILGGLTVAQLARLRMAWHEAAVAMNHIKEFYAEKFESIQLAGAFRWRAKTLPAIYKTKSVSYYTVIEVAMLSGLTFGASIYLFQLGFQFENYIWIITPIAGLLAFELELLIYKRLLK